jgi:hypothetical protein
MQGKDRWRADSESSAGSALTRTAVGFAGKFASNLFEKFWPTVIAKVRGR